MAAETTQPQCTGVQLIAEVFALVRDRLPYVPEDDPLREQLVNSLPVLARSIPRNGMVVVPRMRELEQEGDA